MDILKSENDFYTSVEKALSEIDEHWKEYEGVIVVGSHNPVNIDHKLSVIKDARERKIPFLGICMGMQLAVIEFARNVLDIQNANTEELTDEGDLVIYQLEKLRVGIRVVNYPEGERPESHWHHYAFNQGYHDKFSKHFNISYTDEIAEIMELRSHPYFVGVQFHPEYQSSKLQPHPILIKFLQACKEHTRRNAVAGHQALAA